MLAQVNVSNKVTPQIAVRSTVNYKNAADCCGANMQSCQCNQEAQDDSNAEDRIAQFYSFLFVWICRSDTDAAAA